MPILTCPFKATEGRVLVPPAELYYPGIIQNTELTIQPSADETWDVEGISIPLTIDYTAAFYVNIETTVKNLHKIREAVENQEAAANVQQGILESNKPVLEASYNAAAAVYEKVEAKEPGSIAANEALSAREAAASAFNQNNAALKALTETKEGYVRDLSEIQKELDNLGVPRAAEGLAAPMLVIIAYLYARGNELIWTSQLQAIRIFNNRKEIRTEEFRRAEASIIENVNMHEQFDDPIPIGERENLKLTLQFIGPSALTSFEGSSIGGFEIPSIQPVVNYSRHMEGVEGKSR